MSKTHKRLPKEVFDEVFRFILSVAAHKGLLWGEAIGIDSTTIQANASMRSIVRKDSGKGWKDYTRKLAKKAGLDDPTDDELRQFDRNRPGKKVSNDDWENPHDPDATITRMKNGTTRMAYKAEHAVDLDTDIVVSTTVHTGSTPDTTTIMRAIIGIGGPRSLQDLRALLQTAWTHFGRLISALERLVTALPGHGAHRSTAIGG